MQYYTKKPVTIEAIQIPKGPAPVEQYDAVMTLAEAQGWKVKDLGGEIIISTLEGEMHASPGDWIIKGIKGEFYPCKPDIFDATYSPAEGIPQPLSRNFDFGTALRLIKAGAKCTRANWNGKGMFIFLVNGSRFTVNREPLLSVMGAGVEIDYRAHIDMKTVDGQIVPWVASQTDMLAHDWFVVE